jgi:hypothetical protein
MLYSFQRMPFSFRLLILAFFTCTSCTLYSQGCSDGGVCSVGSLSLVQFKFKFDYLPVDKHTLSQLPVDDNKESLTLKSGPDQKDSSALAKANSQNKNYYYQYPKCFFLLTSSYGLSDQATSISTTQVEANIGLIDQKLFAQVKVPYLLVDGKLGSTNGLGDITLSLSYIAFTKSKSSLSLTGGVKLPSNNANLSNNDMPLPMVYQTSLGSTDGLIGAKYTFKKWDFTLGYQHSFNANKNAYVHRTSGSDTAVYNSYFESGSLRRSDDWVFRINRNFTFHNASFSAGLLPIYHAANDYYTDAAGNRVQSIGSQGLTLNLNFAGTLPVSKKTDFVFVLAGPVIIRQARPDGLTRVFVLMAGFKFSIY